VSGWWSVKRQLPGWVAIAPGAARAQAAHVVCPSGTRPQLRWACEVDWHDPAAGLRSLRRSHHLGQHRSVALLERHQYQLLPMDAPEVPREAWRDAVRWKLRDMVDFAVDDASIDLLDIPPDTSQRGRAGLLVAAAPHAVLASLVHAADDAGTPWQALDVAETALRNIANLCRPTPAQGLNVGTADPVPSAALGLGTAPSIDAVYSASGDLTFTIEAATTPDAPVAAPPAQAQALLGVGESASWLVVTAHGELLLSRPIEITRAQACDASGEGARALRERVALELQRTLDHCDRLFNRVSLGRLLVGPSLPDDFVQDLRELLYLPVLGFDLAELIDLSGVPELADAVGQSRYLSVIGAALRPDLGRARTP
jgi:MSHA biogenesis protein MshI